MPSSTRSASFSGSYESSDHELEHDHTSEQEDVHDNTEQGHVKTANGLTESPTAHQPHASSDQNHLSNGKGRGGSKSRRPTHFVCFPLVTDASVPQLAESLRRFREITTAPPPLRPSEVQRQQHEREMETPERESTSDSAVPDMQADLGRAATGDKADSGNAALKVIPQAAHRPPGTFHLTIGAMDLSDNGQLQRALKVLKSIDFAAFFRDIETDQHVNGVDAGSSKAREVPMDTTHSATSNSSSSTVNANATVSKATGSMSSSRNGNGVTPSHTDSRANKHRGVRYPDGTTLNNTTDIYGRQGYKETVSTVDRYVDKGYQMKERMKQRVKHPLKSLRRGVSPPPSVTGRRLLSGESSRVGSVGGDGMSLRTTTTNQTGWSSGTERPGLGSLEEEPSSVAKQGAMTKEHTKTNSTKPLLVTLKGLGAFQSARKARVFYAPPVDPDGTLLALANIIRQVFKDEGLINEDRALTLHATVANMTYAQKSNHHHGRGGKGGKAGKGGRRGGAPRTIDGTEMIEWVNKGDEGAAEYVWAENVVVDRVRICKMGAEKSDDEVLGMVYRAVEVVVDGEKERAEVVFA